MIDDLVYANPIIRCLYVLIGMILAFIYCNTMDRFRVGCIMGNIIEVVICFVCLLYYLNRKSIMSVNIKLVIDLAVCGFLILIFAYGYGTVSDYLSRDFLSNKGKGISIYIFLFHCPIRNYVYNVFFKQKYFGDITGIIASATIIATTICLSMTMNSVYKRVKAKYKE